MSKLLSINLAIFQPCLQFHPALKAALEISLFSRVKFDQDRIAAYRSNEAGQHGWPHSPLYQKFGRWTVGKRLNKAEVNCRRARPD